MEANDSCDSMIEICGSAHISRLKNGELKGMWGYTIYKSHWANREMTRYFWFLVRKYAVNVL